MAQTTDSGGLSDEGKLMSQEGYSFGSATKRANITLSDKSTLSFGFTYSSSEALKRNVYAGVLTLNGTADAKPTVYLTNITNVSGRVATWDVKGIQGENKENTATFEEQNKMEQENFPFDKFSKKRLGQRRRQFCRYKLYPQGNA